MTAPSDAHPAGGTEISIVVPCYDRLDLLERTLRACMAQIVPAGLPWEIIVADNHAEALARDLVARLAAMSPVALRYVAAPARNIALARNRGVAASQSRFAAFVDDDEAPEADWLAQHHACLARTGADASFGPKFPEFPGGTPPAWDPKGYFYTVDFGMQPDEEIKPLAWWPPRGRGLGTGNSLLRRATCLTDTMPFDETFGRTGGEDTLLFFRLSKKGRRFVWCPSARVHEFHHAERLTKTYMETRLARSARHSATCRMAVSDNRAVTAAGVYGVGIAQIITHGAARVLTGEFRHPDQVRHRFGLRRGLGKLGLGVALDFIPEPRGGKTAE